MTNNKNSDRPLHTKNIQTQKALKVRKAYGTNFIELARKNGWLDTQRRVIRTNETIEIPIINSVEYEDILNAISAGIGKAGKNKKDKINNERFELITQLEPEFKRKNSKFITPFEEIVESLRRTGKFTNIELTSLPKKWELLGDVLVLVLDPHLESHWALIAKVYADVLGVKAVIRRTDIVKHEIRRPGVELLLGNETETIHIENSVKFKFDPMQIMFSSGNIDERIRISKIPKQNETIVDMFCGIGYFALPIAVHSAPSSILACELNPVAFNYLQQNIRLNHVENIVKPILGDNREVLPKSCADRVLMGYLKTEHSHRQAAMEMLKDTGGFIHFHDVGFKNECVDSALDKMNESLISSGLDSKFELSLFDHYKIKSYGPKLTHLVLDIQFK